MESLYLWPANPAASLLVLAILAQVFLYAARHPMHRAFAALGRLLSGGFRVAARFCKSVSTAIAQRDREMLADAGNPRALAFQLKALSEHAANLPRDPRAPAVLAEQRRLAALTAALREADLSELARARESGESEPLAQWLDLFLDGLSALSEEVSHFYFSLTEPRVS